MLECINTIVLTIDEMTERSSKIIIYDGNVLARMHKT